jgi:trehalose-6-phosphate synthase
MQMDNLREKLLSPLKHKVVSGNTQNKVCHQIFPLTIVLWPLLHYVLWTETDGRQEIMWWQDYVKLNQKFAQKIIEIYQPGDISI